MAEKRMFTQKIIDSDAFLDMPLSAQALYFHLNMRADDDGFVNNPKKIQRTVYASEDDLKLLFLKRFVIGFENGVIVIKHWRMHNTLRKDRYTPTLYQEEFDRLQIKKNGAYTDKTTLPAPEQLPDGNQMAPEWQPDGNHMATQCSEDKGSVVSDKSSGDKGSGRETTRTLFDRLHPDYHFSSALIEKMTEWITYKMERKEPYKEQGMKSLLRQLESAYLTYGERAVCELIDECMANNWKGIIFDRLKKAPPPQARPPRARGNVFLDMLDDEG